jgi:hypothetical protein
MVPERKHVKLSTRISIFGLGRIPAPRLHVLAATIAVKALKLDRMNRIYRMKNRET